MFRDQVRRFFAAELVPHLDRWEEEGIADRDMWTKCGAQGLLCPTVPEAYGGLGLDFGYNA
jgi:long-chain-acyl-CoA dehydrogenase